MTAITTPHRVPRAGVVRDALILPWRSYKHYRRVPSLLVFSLTTPLIFVLLFRYVLGGAIDVTGVGYVDFLIPGVIAQSIAFGATETGVAIAADLARGVTDRFRSLPITRSAVLAGRALADTARNVLVALIVLAVGLLIGFRPDDNPGRVAAGLAIALAFGFAFSWVAASVGVAVRNVESVHDAGFVWVIPLTFASSALAPVDTMPTALRWFANINPVTSVVDATRALMLGTAAGSPTLRALLWIAGLLVVFVPLAVRGYQRRWLPFPMDWRLELVILPVSDVDRAKAFYTEKIGFNTDHDVQVSDELRFVQLTPPGSACSIAFGTGITDAPPGSVKGMQIVVPDINAARAELVEHGVDVPEVEHLAWGSFVYFSDPDGNAWAVQQLPPRD